MIIGRYQMKKLGVIVNFKNENLIWDDYIVPMWISGANILKPTLKRSKIKEVMQYTDNPRVTR